jgi:6,7-dimethyl-8-ribityllumazine synthase
MLKSLSRRPLKAGDTEYVIVASEYNARYVDSMVRGAKAELSRAGANQVRIIRVPGAYEIPLVACRLARQHQETVTGPTAIPFPTPLAIICLGVILRGETVHAAHIGEAVSRALMEIQLRYEVPVIHEVLLLENAEQARARCLARRHNRGTEAAQTALAMAGVLADLE